MIRQQFPDARVLLCFFHVMKWMKSKIAKQTVPKTDRNRLFEAFYKCVRTCTVAEYDLQNLIITLPK